MTDPTTAQRVMIPRYEAYHAEKTLGVYLAMDGNFESEYKRLLSLAEDFADKIRTRRASPQEAWYTFYFSF